MSDEATPPAAQVVLDREDLQALLREAVRSFPPGIHGLTAADMERLVSSGVKHAFVEIGLDTSKPEFKLELQKDFAHLRSMRKMTNYIRTSAVGAAVAAAVSAVLTVIWLGVKALAK